MATKQTIHIAPGWKLPQVWPELAARIRQWLRGQQLLERDAVVLLPFAALLPPLRDAFARAGGWQVRVETPLTLSASLAPPAASAPGACTGDGVLDRLNASLLLRSQRGAEALASHDSTVFDHVVTLVVEAAQAFRAAGLARAPGHREAFWAQARAAAAQAAGAATGAGLESRLLAVALEWAAHSCQGNAAQTDALHALEPSAWVVVRLGGADAVADAVAQHSASPALWLDLDPVLPWGDTIADLAPGVAHTLPAVQCTLCSDFEDEAQAAAAGVINAIDEGRVPVALVAVDRALVRRVQALLERVKVPVLDETGWLLATTAAGAQLMATLHGAQALQRAGAGPGLPLQDCPSSCRDPVLAWLKSSSAATGGIDSAGIDALEALWRQRRGGADRAAAERCWQRALELLAPLARGAPGSLQLWLDLTRQVLQAQGSLEVLAADPQGRQVLAALRLQGGPAAWTDAAQATRFNLSGFVSWAASTLEQSPYLPVPDEGASVVLTPLARAFGRSFGQVLVPGADHRQLGGPAPTAALMSPQLARQLGMPDARSKHLQQRLALLHLVRGGPVTFSRRLRDAGEPLSESPDLAWLMQACAASPVANRAWQRWSAPQRQLHPAPVQRPLPTAADDLPARLSASQLDAYRQCPYRFYARAVLRLDEPEELEAALAKRDYGNWLHLVLYRFHSERDYREAPSGQLRQAAAWATRQLAMDEADLLPWRASFEHFCPAYLSWLAEREAKGWFWADGESDHERGGDDLPGTHLKGRLDRLDHGPDGQRQVIDYKTGDETALKRKVQQPLEDTQLAFYAALLASRQEQAGDGADVSLQACYLSLDDAKAPRVIEHADVARTAAVMMQALRGEWQRMRAGAALQALGEGATCDTCEARGLCRRDHWTGEQT